MLFLQVAWTAPAGSKPLSSESKSKIFASAQDQQPADSVPQHDESSDVTHQLTALCELLSSECVKHYKDPPQLQSLSMQASCLLSFHTAITAMASSHSEDSLLIAKDDFQLWLQQQYGQISSLAAACSFEEDDGKQGDGAIVGSVPEAQRAKREQSEDGELPAEASPAASSAASSDADMDVDMEVDDLPSLTQTSIEQISSSLPDPVQATPLSESTAELNESRSAAAELLEAALKPAAVVEPAVQLDRRKEYAAQPVRSFTPPDMPSPVTQLPAAAPIELAPPLPEVASRPFPPIQQHMPLLVWLRQLDSSLLMTDARECQQHNAGLLTHMPTIVHKAAACKHVLDSQAALDMYVGRSHAANEMCTTCPCSSSSGFLASSCQVDRYTILLYDKKWSGAGSYVHLYVV